MQPIGGVKRQAAEIRAADHGLKQKQMRIGQLISPRGKHLMFIRQHPEDR